MGCITNGILLGSHTRPFGGTFFMFSDYERSAVRLAALMEIPNLYIWSHDSVAVGEDGPTHQPVEHLASFRAIPQLEVIRPADAFETAEAYRYFFEKKNTLPGAMVLTRQGVPVLAETAAKAKDGVKKALTFWSTPRALRTSSSWLPVPRSSGLWLRQDPGRRGVKARVVSVPSMECSRSRTPSTRRPCFRPLSRLVSPSRPALPCRGTSTSLLRQARLHRAVRPAGRRRSEHDRPRHHRRARGGSRQGLHRRSRSRQVSPLPPSDEGGLYSRLHLIGLSLEGVYLKICSNTEYKEKNK